MDKSTVSLIVVVLVLVFLFKGEPDVWDGLHAQAMRWASGDCRK